MKRRKPLPVVPALISKHCGTKYRPPIGEALNTLCSLCRGRDRLRYWKRLGESANRDERELKR